MVWRRGGAEPPRGRGRGRGRGPPEPARAGAAGERRGDLGRARGEERFRRGGGGGFEEERGVGGDGRGHGAEDLIGLGVEVRGKVG